MVLRRRLNATDRLCIDDTYLRPVDCGGGGPILGTDAGHLLQHVNDPDLVESYSHEELEEYWNTNRLSYEPEYFAENVAELRLVTDEMLISNLPFAEQQTIAWRQAFCDCYLRLRESNRRKYAKTEQALGAAAQEIAELVAKMGKRPIEKATAGKKRKARAKAKVVTETEAVGIPSGRTLYNWLKAYEKSGCRAIALRDGRRRSGNREPRMPGEVLSALGAAMRYYASQNRPSEADAIAFLGKMIAGLNSERTKRGEKKKLVAPSDRFVREAIKKLPVTATNVARGDVDTAIKARPWIGGGLRTELPGQRIEIDEHELDLMTLCCLAGHWDQMSVEERASVERDRRKIIVAICVVTKVILAFRIIPENSPQAQLMALRMITEDKTKYARAIGLMSHWDYRCGISAIVVDWGFLDERFRIAVADLGGTVEYPGAGDSSARPFIERLNQTISVGPIAQLPGRTFSDPVERGNHPSEQRAGVTDDDLAEAMVAWAVDQYHNTPHDGLFGQTPASAWKQSTNMYGVKAPPDQTTIRSATGIETYRTMSSRGVRFLGNYYWTEAGPLGEHFRDSCELRLAIRIDPLNLGAISVKLPAGWISVPCIDRTMEGVSIEWWLAATRNVRERFRHEAELVRHIAHNAMDVVDRVAKRAYSRANVATHLYSPEQIDQIETAYFQRLNYIDSAPLDEMGDEGLGQLISLPPSKSDTLKASDSPRKNKSRRADRKDAGDEWNMQD